MCVCLCLLYKLDSVSLECRWVSSVTTVTTTTIVTFFRCCSGHTASAAATWFFATCIFIVFVYFIDYVGALSIKWEEDESPKMVETRERERDECEKRVFYFIFFFSQGSAVRWCDNIKQIYIHTCIRTRLHVCLYEKLRLSSGSKKISLEILKALGREKKTGYDTQKLSLLTHSNQMKWNCPTAAVCVWMYALTYLYVCVCETDRVGPCFRVRSQIVACLACN